jgi:hypothetical protein
LERRAPGYVIEREGTKLKVRGGSAGKEWEIVKDYFFVGETKG